MFKLKKKYCALNLLFFLLFILTDLNGNAQEQEVTNQNKFIVGLSAYFDSSDGVIENRLGEIVDESEYTYLSIRPYIGWQLSNKWLLGLDATFVKQKSIVTEESNDLKLSGYGLGIFGRYERNICKNLNLHIRSFLTFSSTKEDFSNFFALRETTYNSIIVGFNPGLTYSFSRRINFLLNIGRVSYNNSLRKGKSSHLEDDVLISKFTNKRNTFTTSLNFAQPILSIEIKI